MSRAGVSVSKSGSPAARPDGIGQSLSPQARALKPSGRLVRLLQDFHIPKDSAAVLTLRAMMSEGLKLDAPSVRAVRDFVLRSAQPGRAAALAARALAAGVPLEDEGVASLLRQVSSLPLDETAREPPGETPKQAGRDSHGELGGEAGDEPGDQGSRERGRQDARHRDQGGQGQLQAGRAPGPVSLACDDEAELGTALASAFLEFAASAAADPGLATLARRGPGAQGWLCVPYRITLDGVDFSGYFRIVFNYLAGKVERLVAEIDVSGQTRVLDIAWGSAGKPRMRYMPGASMEGKEFLGLFGRSIEVDLVDPVEDSLLVDDDFQELDGHE